MKQYSSWGGGCLPDAKKVPLPLLTADSSPQPDTMPTGVQ